MVRSGCVSNRARAGSPTITFPSGSTLTTEGQSIEPCGPGIHFGSPVCASMYAIRLNVVPRSIPTTRPIFFSGLCQFFLYAGDEIADIAASVEYFVHACEERAARRFSGAGVECGIPFAGDGREFGVHFFELLQKILLGLTEALAQRGGIAAFGAGFAQFVERFIQLKNFLEQFRRSLLPGGALFAQPEMQQQIFDARDGLAQRAIRVIQFGRALERKIALEFARANKIIRVQLPAQLVKLRFERCRIHRELLRQPEKREVICASRQCLNLSTRGAEMRASGGRLATPALR